MSLMISSCCTFLLKRRSALSRVSPSWMITSAKLLLHPFLLENLKVPVTALRRNRFRPDNGGNLTIILGTRRRRSEVVFLL